MAWDNYYGKHCSRLYGWLPASKEFKMRKGDAKLKYLTLSDTEAIDIFMLEMEGILERDENNALTDVTICEMDESKIAEIFQNVKPPLRESIVKGKIEHLLLFKDTEELSDLEETGADVRSLEQRKQLNMRRDAMRLQETFPFDIINFDPCNSILGPEKELFKAFGKLFELQKGVDEFLIFSTTPINAKDPILKLFKQDFDQNIKDHPVIKEISNKVLGTTDFDEITDEHAKISIGFGKTLIAKLAIKHGFKSVQKGIYIYESHNGTFMLSSVTELHVSKNENIEEWYPKEIANLIQNMPTIYPLCVAEQDDMVKDHLKAVITSRNEIQKQFLN